MGDLASALEEAKARRNMLHCVFLDIKQAFDTLPHNVILQRLRLLGVKGKMLEYIKAFLSRRTIRVRVPGALSSPCTVTQGVPQGSVLSPLLFMWPWQRFQAHFASRDRSMCRYPSMQMMWLFGALAQLEGQGRFVVNSKRHSIQSAMPSKNSD